MKCFIIFTVLIVTTVVVVKADKSEADSNPSSSEIVTISENQLKKQEKRGIDYNTIGGYTSGLGVDGTLGTLGGVGYNGIPGYNGGIGYTGAIGGYNSGYYNPYTPPRVAGLGGISSYTNPGYYNSGYNSGYNTGYSGYSGYNGGYGYPSTGYSSSRLASPYTRQGYYNSYPSSYYNSQLGSSIVGGGLGLGIGPTSVPVVAGGGYQYGPGISGGIY